LTPRLLAGLLAILLLSTLVGACGKSSPQTTNSAAATASGGNGADPGTCPNQNTISFAKTKFVAHSGLALGAFHRYIYKPFRAGKFSAGQHGRLLAFVKAAAAALFVKHEVRLAAQDAQANPTLCRAIAAPLRSFYDGIIGIGSRIRRGDTSGIDNAENSAGGLSSASSSSAVPIQENENVSV
jgi:hypothetical protein